MASSQKNVGSPETEDSESETIKQELGTKPSSQSGPIVVLKKSIIRPYHLSDAEELARIANNPTVGRYMRNHFPSPYTIDDANFWINFNITASPVYNFCIAHPESNKIMGSIGLIPGEDVHCRSAELGYWIGEEYWGKGIVTEAVKGFVDWTYANFPQMERLHSDIFEDNKASIAVVERAGFLFEGRLRKAVYKNGKHMDALAYSFIREDLDAKRK
jgi:ribosomal-protein-alanine N-acetyltransferase